MNLEDNNIKHPFKVPDGYFEKLNENILNQSAELDSAKKATRIWKYLGTGLAASLLIFLGFYWNEVPKQNDIVEKEIATISQSQTIAFLENENLDLVEISNEINFSENEITDFATENLPANINQEEILNELENEILN